MTRGVSRWRPRPPRAGAGGGPLEPLQELEHDKAPAALRIALDELDPAVWQRLPRAVFLLPSAGVELSVSRTAAGDLVGISRADFEPGDVLRRALVIAPGFQRTAESLELTRAELAAYFGRGVRAVEYMVRLDHTVATARVELLAAEKLGAPVRGYQAYRISADRFEGETLRRFAERVHVRTTRQTQRL